MHTIVLVRVSRDRVGGLAKLSVLGFASEEGNFSDDAVDSKLPSILHHECEVVIAVDGAADALVILAELFEGHDSVGLLAVPLRHELLEHLVGGLLALLNIRVLASIVDLRDVLQSDLPVLGDIEFVVGEPDPLFPLLVQVSLQKQSLVRSSSN